MNATRRRQLTKFEDGFGIIEVIVSMFLLSLMAMAFLPVLVQSLQVSRVNASIATATQLLSADLDRARASHPGCGSNSSADAPDDDAFTVNGKWAASFTCAEDLPTTVSYTSTIKDAATNEVLAEAVTLILVTE
ncbi:MULTISPECIES: type II secretion system protein J [unclassified Cryobacterium]|uniref:PulJ/GspJ family protein n=1 Tax=unclassified Cryobacterium TaxID=2649013 RepID=UPI000CE4DDEA|nr:MULTISPECIES: hypothetical protein [unclassified Cryobacterium]